MKSEQERVSTLRFVITTLMLLSGCLPSEASEQIPPYPSEPCEIEWENRANFDTVPNHFALSTLERWAKEGDVSAQLRLGLLARTLDGRWSAPQDGSYNERWLKAAADAGNKSAAWQLARRQFRSISQPEYFRSMIAAAEIDGDPWAATELFRWTGRTGKEYIPKVCLANPEPDGQCAEKNLLPMSSGAKWARIAAQGGNAATQEWLCRSSSRGNEERGQPKDAAAARKWCAIAAHSACAYWTLQLSAETYGDSPEEQSEAARLRAAELQPWRKNRYFFTRNQ